MVKRANCAIVEMAINMLYAQNINKLFWAEVVANAAYTCNRCLMRAIPYVTPEKNREVGGKIVLHT